MSYSIQNIVFGIPLTQKVWEVCDRLKLEPEDLGFELLYNGGGDNTPGYLGVSLGEMDEVCHYVRFGPDRLTAVWPGKAEELSLRPTADQVQQVQELISKLPHKVRAVACTLGVYLIYSSS